MGKHNDKEFQDKIKMTFRHNLEKQFRNGLAQGMYASCKVIHDKAVNSEKTADEKLAEIISFCRQITKMDETHADTSQKAVE